MNKIIIIVCSCILFFSCKPGEPSQESADYQYQGDTLCVSSKSNILEKIKLLTIQPKSYSAELNTTGTVKAIPGQLVEIAPPFDGRVMKSYIRLGQKVSVGTVLFELSSAQFYEASKVYFQASQAKKMASVNYQRQKDLVQHGVGVQKELEEAETNYEIAQKDYENAVASLKMFSINPEELVMGQPLKIVSPIAGEVVQNNIILGQYIKSDAAPLAVVAELSKVWVVAEAKEKYINSIHPDDQVEIRTDADNEHVITGRVYHISELLNEETRSVQVLITCDNMDRKLKPGMFTSVHFINAPKESVIIPSSSVLQSESDSYVFVKVGDNKYSKRSVKIVTTTSGEILVSDGLQTGDTIISEGGIYLIGN